MTFVRFVKIVLVWDAVMVFLNSLVCAVELAAGLPLPVTNFATAVAGFVGMLLFIYIFKEQLFERKNLN